MDANVLLLHCHDLGRFLGAYGVETVRTPRLDALAAEGTLFEQAFATAPHCSPARASLFTGTYPQRNGVLGLTHEPFGWDLADPRTHIAARLQAAGHRTELVGVHHESKVLPDDEVATRLGFDRVRSGGSRDVVVARAIGALDAAAADGARFYLQVGFTEPHRVASPTDPAGVMGFLAEGVEPDSTLGIGVPPYLRDDEGARIEIAELQGAVAHMDAGVGMVLDHLAGLGLDEETIVVFTTDHGLALPAAKCTLSDAGVGVALMMRVPGRPSWRGRRIRGLVSHVDVMPTVLELLGLAMPADLEGTSLVTSVETASSTRPHAFSQLTHHTYFDPKRSVRSERHRLILNLSNAPGAMDPTQSWMHRSIPTLLTGPTIATSPMLELYDLVDDPHQRRNRAGEPSLAAVEDELAHELLAWMLSTEDPLLDARAAAAPRRLRDALDHLERASKRHRDAIDADVRTPPVPPRGPQHEEILQ